MVIVTHDEEIALSADRIIRIEDGLVVSDEVIRWIFLKNILKEILKTIGKVIIQQELLYS